MRFSEKEPKPPHLTAIGLMVGLVLTYLTEIIGLMMLVAGMYFSIRTLSVIPFIIAAVLAFPLSKALEKLTGRALKRYEK